MERFKDKVVVVTGAGQGLDKVVAKMFADEGAKVILAGRTASKVENAAAEIGGSAVPFTMDCGVEADWARLVDFIKSSYGELDYLVNNAAIIMQKDILTMTFEEFKETEHCNLDSVFLGMKYCHEVLKKGVYSAIVNISSVGGLKAGPSTGNDAGYNATKAGVRNLTKHAAYVFAPEAIRVNSVHPSGINTQMRKDVIAAHPELEAAAAATNPIPPYCSEPEEVASVVLFLCDPASRTMTGSEVVIDSGAMCI